MISSWDQLRFAQQQTAWTLIYFDQLAANSDEMFVGWSSLGQLSRPHPVGMKPTGEPLDPGTTGRPGPRELHQLRGVVQIDNRLGYAGYVWDPFLQMYHVRHRVLNPRLGIWMQPDPIGYAGGWNLHEYCNGDPLNFVDPMGLFGIGDAWNSVTGAVHWVASSVGGFVGDQAFYAAQGLGLSNGSAATVANGAEGATTGVANAGIYIVGGGIAIAGAAAISPVAGSLAAIGAAGLGAYGAYEAGVGINEAIVGEDVNGNSLNGKQRWERAGNGVVAVAATTVAAVKVAKGKGGNAQVVPEPPAAGKGCGGVPANIKLSPRPLDELGGGPGAAPRPTTGSSEAAGSATHQLLLNQLAAAEIAGGHAFGKHVLSRGEFPGWIRTRSQFQSLVNEVINNPTAIRMLSNNRIAYWHEGSGTVVIRNPTAADGGTAFQPTRGRLYFEALK